MGEDTGQLLRVHRLQQGTGYDDVVVPEGGGVGVFFILYIQVEVVGGRPGALAHKEQGIFNGRQLVPFGLPCAKQPQHDALCRGGTV